jgi:hypothetical protein
MKSKKQGLYEQRMIETRNKGICNVHEGDCQDTPRPHPPTSHSYAQQAAARAIK